MDKGHMGVFNSVRWNKEIAFDDKTRSFHYDQGVCGPSAEVRSLKEIGHAFLDSTAVGPEWLYAIAMDVYREEHRKILEEAMLLLGVVVYNRGTVGREPVRSQGHIHRVSLHSGWSPPEIFEIWQGRAIVMMQESADSDAGTCYALSVGPGDHVIVPPGWPHMVINASCEEPMVFGAVCDRGYEGFEYDQLRVRGGLAYLPVLDDNGATQWQRNGSYHSSRLVEKAPERYGVFDSLRGGGIYRTMCEDPGRVSFVSRPGERREWWGSFIP